MYTRFGHFYVLNEFRAKDGKPHQTQRYKTVIDIGGGIQTIFKQTNNKFSLTLVLVFSID